MEKGTCRILTVAVLVVIIIIAGTYLVHAQSDDGVDYSDVRNWAYYDAGDHDAVTFLIAPTIDMTDEFNMDISSDELRSYFYGALEMEKHLYSDVSTLYAPYYRQASMKVYSLNKEEQEQYLSKAFVDVSDAFRMFLRIVGDDRPIILAGFSQGADMCYRLLETYFEDESLMGRLVAVYALGWPCSEDIVSKYPQIRPAQSSDDVGTVITFDCESPDVEDTFINQKRSWTYSINPLNWKTDGTVADRSDNIGARIMNADGEVIEEIPNMCGCYIDLERGVLKVSDVNPAKYPPLVPGLPDGAFHVYDYQFFFENLRQNVSDRLEAYLSYHSVSA